MLSLFRHAQILKGLKNASYLSIGGIISQIVNFIGFIFIARLWGPYDYGIYLTVLAFVSFFSILSLNGLHTALIREGAKNPSMLSFIMERYIGLRNFFAILSILICSITILLIPGYDAKIRIYIIIYSVTLFTDSFNEYINIIYQVEEKMKYISIVRLLNRILFVSSTISFLLLHLPLIDIFLIIIAVNFITIIANYIISKKISPFRVNFHINKDGKLIKIATTFSIISFLGVIATRIDILMISFLGTSIMVGIYGLADRIINQGLMIRSFFVIAFLPIFVKEFEMRRINHKVVIKYSIYISIIFLLIAIIGFFIAPYVIPILFGQEYIESIIILQVLIFYLPISWSTIPLELSLIAISKEKRIIVINLAAAILNVIFNIYLFKTIGLIGIAISTLITTFSAFILMTLYAYHDVKQNYFARG